MGKAILILLLIFCNCKFGLAREKDSEQDKNDSNAIVRFEKTTHDFGKIEYDGDGTFGFVLENRGKEPLLISRVRPVCGCTVPSWPDKPVLPGNKDTITVVYNTRIVGYFSKSVRVYTNLEKSPIVLILKGEVLTSR